jgi:hypothetical protein
LEIVAMTEPSSFGSKWEVSRRDALKALAAASGALVASGMLPKSWTSPVVETGIVPAHAQSTACFEQVDLVVDQCLDSTCPPGAAFGIHVYYSPGNLLPSKVENTIIDCQCFNINTTLKFIGPGHIVLWYTLEETNGSCVCEFQSTLHFRGGCLILISIKVIVDETSRPTKIEVKKL